MRYDNAMTAVIRHSESIATPWGQQGRNHIWGERLKEQNDWVTGRVFTATSNVFGQPKSKIRNFSPLKPQIERR